MTISELWRYPVKSMAGERLTQTPLTLEGILGDRVLHVVDGRGQILSARTSPGFCCTTHHLRGGEVLVDGLPWESPQVTELDACGR